jgi:1,4-alpha-glucan branching enzyme
MVTVRGNLVEFEFYRPRVGQVHLVGDFNGWRDGELAMQGTPEGYWRATLSLPAGTFRFRYRADGHWFTDFAACGVERGPSGWDSVIQVLPGNEDAAGALLAWPKSKTRSPQTAA